MIANARAKSGSRPQTAASIRHSRGRRRMAVASLFLLAVSVAACTEKTPPPAKGLSSGSETARAIAVVPIRYTGEVVIKRPVAGAAAGMSEGARQGGLGSLLGGASAAGAGSPAAAALGIAVVPIAAAIGAIVGASSAHSEEEVEAAATALAGAFVGAHCEIALRDRLMAMEGSRGTYELRGFGAMDSRPDYWREVPVGTDLVLEITVESFGLLSSGRIAPDVAVYLGIRANVVRATDGSEIRSSSWAYVGKRRDYFAAAANDARLLRLDIDLAIAGIATAIASELLTGSGQSPASHVQPGFVGRASR